MNYVQTRLSEAAAILSAVALIVEDGDAEVSPAACRELARINEYVERVAAKATVTA